MSDSPGLNIQAPLFASATLKALQALPVQECNDDANLAACCARWSACPALALDTEFERTRTFWPTLALVQVCDGQTITLIDALAIRDWAPFAALLTETSVVKVMHAASEDLEAFLAQCGHMPEPLFDTQQALAWLGEGLSVGLSATLERYFGVSLDKGMARTDWIARPLSDAQKLYAADDVRYLLPVYQDLADRMARHSLRARFEEDSVFARAKTRAVEPEQQAWRKLKAAFVLKGSQIPVAQALCAWRDGEARRSNSARSFLVKDDVLLAIAQASPRSWNALAAIEGLHPRVLRVHGKALLAAVEQGLAVAPEQRPPRVSRIIDVSGGKTLLENAVAAVAAIASQEQAPAELYFSRRVLENLLVAVVDALPQAPLAWQGWRREMCKEALARVVTSGGLSLPEWW